MPKTKQTFEENIEIIDEEIAKRRSTWRLDAIAWMDYDDVSQILRTHIYRKWNQWDQKRSLKPWINKIISNQIKNLLRNNYHNYAKPCSGCPFNDLNSEESCSYTKSKKQDKTCPLYLKWFNTKKPAYHLNLPVSLDDVVIAKSNGDSFAIEGLIKKIDKELKAELSEKHYVAFKMLFIQNIDEEEVAKIMGYKTNEKGRKAGYKQIKNLKSRFKKVVKKIIEKKDII